MVEKNTIDMIVFNSIKEMNSELSEKQKIQQSRQTVLFGKGGILDSLSLVNLIIIIEQNINEELDISITIADERAMSQKNSPFKTVGTLSDYINTLLNQV